MKKVLAIILLTFGSSIIYAQGIFTGKGNTSLDVGVGLTHANAFNYLIISAHQFKELWI